MSSLVRLSGEGGQAAMRTLLRPVHQRASSTAAALRERAARGDQVAAAELRALLERYRNQRRRPARECIVGVVDCPICGTGLYAPRD